MSLKPSIKVAIKNKLDKLKKDVRVFTKLWISRKKNLILDQSYLVKKVNVSNRKKRLL